MPTDRYKKTHEERLVRRGEQEHRESLVPERCFWAKHSDMVCDRCKHRIVEGTYTAMFVVGTERRYRHANLDSCHIGGWRDPVALLDRLARQIKAGDGCVECGYSLHYELEGCDACAPITELLKAAGQTHQDGRRS
jgi:hypothetical protein